MPRLPVRLRSPRLALVAASLILGLASCDREIEPPVKAPAPAPAPITVTAPPIVFDRAGFLAAVDTTAAAYASGASPSGQDTLVGRRFMIRQAFGCGGPLPSTAAVGDGLASWSVSEDGQTQRLTLTPGDWTQTALAADEEPIWEAAEGIWLARPWLRADTCPQVRADQSAAGPAAVSSPQTVGLAAVFEADGSRLDRRNGRAYSFTLRGEGDQPPPPQVGGYRLVLEGRFTAFPDGRAIRCRATNVDQRPVCIAAVQLDRVAFEDADGGVISNWRTG
ncbi:hypothetical protein [Brevundimonas sp.]